MVNCRWAIVLFAFFMTDCTSSDKDAAKMLMDEAGNAYMQKDYNKSKILLDSLIHTYPKEKEITIQAKEFMRIVKKSEQDRNLIFLDSLLNARESELKLMMKDFNSIDNFGDMPWLEHKRQSTSNSYLRSFVKIHVNPNGNFYISSHLCAKEYINHNSIRVYFGNNSATTEQIDSKTMVNKFDDGKYYWETINYRQNSDNGVTDFISQHCKEMLKVEFVGEKKSQYIVMNDYDKDAIREGYEMAFIFREVIQIKQQIRSVKQSLKELTNNKGIH